MPNNTSLPLIEERGPGQAKNLVNGERETLRFRSRQARAAQAGHISGKQRKGRRDQRHPISTLLFNVDNYRFGVMLVGSIPLRGDLCGMFSSTNREFSMSSY